MNTATFGPLRWLTANPAASLMTRLSYPKKIQVVGLVAAFAILLLTGQLFFSLAGQIERASLERTGIVLIRPLRTLIEPLQQHRGLLNAYLSADEPYRQAHGEFLRQAIGTRAAAVETGIAEVEAKFAHHLPQMVQDPRWRHFKAAWQTLKASGTAGQADATLNEHNELIGDLTALIGNTADASHLSVDPYVGTYYLAQMITHNLPAIIEDISRIRDMGTGVYASKELERDDKYLLISLNTMAATSFKDATDTVRQKIIAVSPELATPLGTALEDIEKAPAAIDSFTQFKLLSKLFTSQPHAFFASMTYDGTEDLQRFQVGDSDLSLDSGERISAGPIGAAYRTLDRFTVLLEETVESRLWALYRQLALNLAVAASALIVVIYMLYLMYVSFPIRKLISATEQVAGGDLEVKLEIERNDEIGQLARAFNVMTEAVKFNQLNLEHLVAERTADLTAKNHLIMESINYARVIQQSYLRASKQDMAATLSDYTMHWEPRDTVGGDYLYFRQFGDGYFFAVIDCTGHGVPGAFMTLIMASYLNNLLSHDNRHDPAGLLAKMNWAVKHALGQIEGRQHDDPELEHASDDGMDAAFCWVDVTRQTLTYAGAKTPLYILEPGAEDLAMLDGERKGVGYTGTALDFAWRNQTIPLPHGTRIYATTDGIIDQVGETKRMAFGKRRFKQAILANREAPMTVQRDAILDAYRQHQGKESRRDDVSLFAFRHP